MSLSKSDRERLQAGVATLLPGADSQIAEPLERVCTLLMKWSRAFNLTAIREPRDIVDLHILDSLSIAPWLHGESILDVGTGAGFPGLPLAIALPDRHFTLLDANAKKLRFVQQVVAELGLGNVTICHDRVPDYAPTTGFDTVTARAFAGLAQIVGDCAHLLTDEGCIVAMKSREAEREVGELDSGWQSQLITLAIPGQALERHAVVVRRAERKTMEIKHDT